MRSWVFIVPSAMPPKAMAKIDNMMRINRFIKHLRFLSDGKVSKKNRYGVHFFLLFRGWCIRISSRRRVRSMCTYISVVVMLSWPRSC